MACNPEGQMDRRKAQYNKIIGLDAVANTIADRYAIEINQESVPVGDFLEVVDLSNAHMCLQSMMHTAEYRYAYAVIHALDKGVSLEQLAGIVKDAGKENKPERALEIDDMFVYMMNNVLDGMPCDETYEVIENSEYEIVWKKLEDSHEVFWKRQGKDVDIYYELLASYLDGMLEDSGYSFDNNGNEFFTLTKQV